MLKALGFTRRLLLTFFVGESMALALLGGLLGALAGAGLVRVMADAAQMTGLFNGLRATWGTLAVSMTTATLVGFLSGVIPSLSAASTEIVKGLSNMG